MSQSALDVDYGDLYSLPEMPDFKRGKSPRPGPTSSEIADGPSRRAFFARLREEARQMIDNTFNTIRGNATASPPDVTIHDVPTKTNEISELNVSDNLLAKEFLNNTQTKLQAYLDECATKTAEKVDLMTPEVQEFHLQFWYKTLDFFPDVLKWYEIIFNKMVKAKMAATSPKRCGMDLLLFISIQKLELDALRL